jgi:hypothetical protein
VYVLQIYNKSIRQIPAIATIMFIDTFTSLPHNMLRPCAIAGVCLIDLCYIPVILVCKFQFVSFLSPLPHTVSEPLTNRAVLLSSLLQDSLHPSHHLLNVSL